MAFYDFTGANGDPIPDGLTAENGTFEIQSNKLAPTGVDPGGVKWVITETASTFSDATVEGTVNLPSGADNSDAGLVVRYGDTDNFWLFDIQFAFGHVRLIKRVSGSWSGATTSADSAIGKGVDLQLKVVCQGSSIEVYLNGSLKMTRTDSALSSNTRHGMRATSNEFLMDNFGTFGSTTPTLTAKITGITATSAVPVTDVEF